MRKRKADRRVFACTPCRYTPDRTKKLHCDLNAARSRAVELTIAWRRSVEVVLARHDSLIGRGRLGKLAQHLYTGESIVEKISITRQSKSPSFRSPMCVHQRKPTCEFDVQAMEVFGCGSKCLSILNSKRCVC